MEAQSVRLGKAKGDLAHELERAKNAAFFDRFDAAKEKILDAAQDKFEAAQKAYNTQVTMQKQ